MKGSGAFDKKLKKAAIGALTRAYKDVLSGVKYTEAFAYMKENKHLCEFDKIINAKSIDSYELLRSYLNIICKPGDKQANNYKYYSIRNMYNIYEDKLVEIGSWGSLFLMIGACANAKQFPDDREVLEPLTEYITALFAIHNYIGKYEDFIFACMETDIQHTVSDIVYDAISDLEIVKQNEEQIQV